MNESSSPDTVPHNKRTSPPLWLAGSMASALLLIVAGLFVLGRVLFASPGPATTSLTTPGSPVAQAPAAVTDVPAPLATATATPTATAASTVTPTVEPAVIGYWEQEGEDGDQVLDELVAGFMRANPGVVVQRAHVDNEEMLTRFATSVAGGQAPALLRATHDLVGPLTELDLIGPVASLTGSADAKQYLPGALSAAMISGTLRAVPDNYGGHLMLYYNRKLVSEVPPDTDAWITQLKTLTDASKGRFGLVYNLDEPYWLMPWLGGFGGWVIDTQDRLTLDTTAMKDALQFVQDLKLVHKVVPVRADYDTAATMFLQGQAAYLIDGPWNLDAYRAALDLGIATLPQVSKTGLYPSPMAGGKYWYFNRELNGAQLAASQRFVAYMTSDFAQQKWLALGRLPSNPTVADSLQVAQDPILSAAMGQLSKSRGIPSAPAMACAWRTMRPPLESVMADRAQPAAAARKMQEESAQCLAAPRPDP